MNLSLASQQVFFNEIGLILMKLFGACGSNKEQQSLQKNSTVSFVDFFFLSLHLFSLVTLIFKSK